MNFVDTNYFLRYLRDDIPDQTKIVKRLFLEAAAGKKQLFSSTIVFFEIFWVAGTYYEYEKIEVINALESIINKLSFIYFEERQILKVSLDIFKETNLELEDCYNIAYAKINETKEFATFDKKLLNYLNK